MPVRRLEEFLTRGLEAIFELAWLNRRMTARGLVAAVVFLAARYGFEISAETQAGLATLIFLYLGLVGRDRQRRNQR